VVNCALKRKTAGKAARKTIRKTVRKGGKRMCLSAVYKNEVSDANLLAKNVADIRVDGGKIVFTDLMGIRTVFDGSLEKVDLMDNYVIVRG